MDNKVFYWIRLRTNFFESDEIDFLMSQDNGAEYVVLYQMLMLKTANMGGVLGTRIGEVIVPYDVKKIVRDTKYFDADTVMVALELFKQLGLIYVESDGQLVIAQVKNLVGTESSSRAAIIKRNQRQNRADKNVDVLVDKKVDKMSTEKEIEKEIENRDRDKELDTEKDKECSNARADKPVKDKKPPKKSYGVYKNVKLTDEEYNRLCADYGQEKLNKAIDFFDAYIEEKDYKSKSHNLAMRRWVFDAVKENQARQTKTNRTQQQEQESIAERWANIE